MNRKSTDTTTGRKSTRAAKPRGQRRERSEGPRSDATARDDAQQRGQRNKKPLVLITGATGAIGAAITRRLQDAYRIVGLDLDCGGAKDCLETDLTSAQALQRTVATVAQRHGRRVASVIHLAAYYDMEGEPDPRYEAVNVRGTVNLLEALKALDVEQFIYASTMLVHAPTEPGTPIDETAPIEPKWPYPQSKLDAENAAHAAHGDMPLLVLRIAGMYDDGCHSATLSQQIQRIRERSIQAHLYPGELDRGQAFVHLEDLCEAFAQAVERRKQLPADATLLIGEPETVSYGELQQRLGQLLHGEPEWETRQIPKAVARTGAWLQGRIEDIVPDAIDRGEEPFIKPYMVDLADDHFELDISRARELLGWEPQRRLRETLPVMIDALKRDPLAWYRSNGLTAPGATQRTGDLDEEERAVLDEKRRSIEAWRQTTVWAHLLVATLGIWIVTSPFALGYRDETALTISDVATGALICVLGLISLSRRHGRWAQWANVFVGTWLMFAPLVFYTHSPAAYANDTLVGTLVIALAILIPNTPGVGVVGRALGPDVPPGWDYSPSDWTQRLPIILLALAGFFIARYMAAYQLGHTNAVWDPFFGDGTERIITSKVSEAWPIPDAGLGAVSYMLEVLSGIIGSRARWRTMPWLVGLFGVLIVPLGGVSILFIIIQPIVIGTWCTLCLIAAAGMVVMIPYSLDELVATGQFLRERLRAGRPFWSTVLHGDTMEGGRKEAQFEFEQPPTKFIREMIVGGVGATWTLNLSAAIGVWLMCTRLIFDTQGAMANSDHVVGSLVIVIAVSAWAEVARPLRFINIAFGAWLLAAPWLLDGASMAASIGSVVAGIALIGLSIPRGKIKQRYGAWNKLIV